jgi:hypothetical protein
MTRGVLAVSESAASIRGVYLWAGRATIDLHNVKFPDFGVDEAEHLRAHSPAAALELADTGFNWAFLSMNWGFPPERERRHWQEFQDAVGTYRNAGFRTIGYVQASNCLAEGSYADRDWYAVTPSGRRVPYYLNRLMTCWNSDAWSDEVGRHAERAIVAGADGVFFDNLWMGATPWTLGGRVGGFAGCACTRCTRAFRDAHGHAIPRTLDDDDASRAYLAWRTEIVSRRMSEWGERVRERDSRAIVLANNCDAILRDTRALFGLDVSAIGAAQDAVLVENIAMPSYDARARRLTSNAIPVKALHALTDRPVLCVTYERGIGLDRAPRPLLLRRTIAETAALGASTILKGSEYIDSGGRFTVITAAEFVTVRAAVRPLLRWIQSNAGLYTDVRHDPEVGVLYDTAALQRRYGDVAAATFALATRLLADSTCFAFVTPDRLATGEWAGRRVLVPPGQRFDGTDGGAQLVYVSHAVCQLPPTPAQFLNSRAVRRACNMALTSISRAYFGSARARRALDASGITASFLRSPYFRIPARRGGMNGLAPDWSTTRVSAASPVLVERWFRERDGARLIHLVNFSDTPARVQLGGVISSTVELHSPDADTRLRTGARLEMDLELYAVLELRRH